jgi:hypothetical protein
LHEQQRIFFILVLLVRVGGDRNKGGDGDGVAAAVPQIVTVFEHHCPRLEPLTAIFRKAAAMPNLATASGAVRFSNP